MKKRTPFLVGLTLVSLALAAGADAAPDRFWSVDAQYVDGWYGTDWFGWVAPSGIDPNWVYHTEHGWGFSTDTSPNSVYWWCSSTGWSWFSKNHYPWMYRMANGHWLFYLKGSKSWYYDAISARWIENPAETLDNEMILVFGGTFNLGVRPTQVSAFTISKYETTWSEWVEVRDWAAVNGYDIGTHGQGCAFNHPVRYVNWYDTVKWCNARSEKEGLWPVYFMDDAHTQVYRTGNHKVTNAQASWSASGYRLPTEAEWQFAASGGVSSKGYLYSGSNVLEEVGRYAGNAGGAECDLSSQQTGQGTWPVGSLEPNELGIYDMSGNVAEWCWDWWGSILSFTLETDPHGPDTGHLLYRIQRGGGWPNADVNCATTDRTYIDPSAFGHFVGFRVVRKAD